MAGLLQRQARGDRVQERRADGLVHRHLVRVGPPGRRARVLTLERGQPTPLLGFGLE